MIQNDLLYSTKPVAILGGNDRQSHTNDKKAFNTDDNLKDREDKFRAQIDSKCVYFCDLGKKKFPKNLKISCTLQAEMKKLFEWEKKVIK